MLRTSRCLVSDMPDPATRTHVMRTLREWTFIGVRNAIHECMHE